MEVKNDVVDKPVPNSLCLKLAAWSPFEELLSVKNYLRAGVCVCVCVCVWAWGYLF